MIGHPNHPALDRKYFHHQQSNCTDFLFLFYSIYLFIYLIVLTLFFWLITEFWLLSFEKFCFFHNTLNRLSISFVSKPLKLRYLIILSCLTKNNLQQRKHYVNLDMSSKKTKFSVF